MNQRIAVIGGGISGLAAAFRLSEIAAAHELPLEINVLESSNRLGGSIDTVHRDGFTIETGADSFISEKTSAIELAAKLELQHELIGTQERYRKTLIVRRSRLYEIPPGFSLLAPARLGPFLRSPILSPWGKFRAVLDLVLPRATESGDESLASFISRRLGREVLERIVQPLAGGIYTADPETLSTQATFSRFVGLEHRYGSLIRGLRAEQANREADLGATGARWSLFLSFKGGMRTLIDALGARLRKSVRLQSGVSRIERGGDNRGWRIQLADGSQLDCEALICATPAGVTARLIESSHQLLAKRLRKISYASAATVNLGYRASDFLTPPSSFGFVVPAVERRKIIACSFSSLKFPGRAPPGTILLRVFLGGALQHQMISLDDQSMIAAAREELHSLMGVSAEPVISHVERHADSMPQYAVGHLDRVRAIEQSAAELSGFALAGSYLYGVGIPDCISSGQRAAEATSASLLDVDG